MKISQQLPSTRVHTEKQAYNNNCFEKHLMTPTQQESGDEYYRAHQHQLQQSCLQFKQSDTPTKQSQTLLLTTEAPRDHNGQHSHTSENEHTKYTPQVSLTLNSKTSILVQELSTQALTQIKKERCTPLAYNNPAQSLDARIRANNTKVMTSTPPQSQFKNHHVFIQGNEIELTLNTYSLNSTEQHELEQLIKQELKKSGLHLKMLIINGVIHD